MAFTHKKTVYKPIETANPFLRGQDAAYADILQHALDEARTWRRSAVLNAALFAIALILFFASVRQQKTVPVLVNVMPSGESQYLGEVRQNGDMRVPEAAILYQLRDFVSCLRSVSTDYQVVYDNIDKCFVMAASAYSPVMRRNLLADSPFDQVGKIRRSVSIESVLHVTGRSYQVNWTENVIDASSAQKSSKMRAVATVLLLSPNEATIKRNPLGIYIENFEIVEL
jgi:type IV secretion system protein VirB5